MHDIVTSRLLLRKFEASDAEALFQVMGNDPQMTWDKTSRTLEQVTRTVTERMAHVERMGFGLWAVIEKANGQLIGQVGLQMMDGSSEIELVAYIARPRWQEGFAREASAAALRYGFRVLELPQIAAVTLLDNVRAQHLLKSLGFEFIRETVAYGDPVQYWVSLRERFPSGEGAYSVIADGRPLG